MVALGTIVAVEGVNIARFFPVFLDFPREK